MKLKEVIKIKRDFKLVNKKLKDFLKQVYKTHTKVTAYHFKKALEHFQGYQIVGTKYFSFLFKGNEYYIAYEEDEGKLFLLNKILYFSDNNTGFELIL